MLCNATVPTLAQDTTSEPVDTAIERQERQAAPPTERSETPAEQTLPGDVSPVVPPPPASELAPSESSQVAEPAASDHEASGESADQPAPAPLPRQAEPIPAPGPPADQAAPTADAAEIEPEPARPPPVEAVSLPWTFALTTGYYRPRLSTLNRVLRDTSVTIMEDPNFLLPRNLEFSFEERNLSVPGIEGGLNYGISMAFNTGGPHSLVWSFSGWRGETFGRDRIPLFLRSGTASIDVPRSARYNLVLDQMFLEWRYHLLRNAQGKGVYVNIGLVGVTLAFLTMDALVNVVDPQGEVNFASVSSDESFGWGYTTRFGVGAEYPLTSWLSFGGRANYVLGTIRRMTVTRHFLAGFPVVPLTVPLSIQPGVALPTTFFAPLEGAPVTYAPVTTTQDVQEVAGERRELPLELSGWEGIVELSVRF
jgi:hypothetical protein